MVFNAVMEERAKSNLIVFTGVAFVVIVVIVATVVFLILPSDSPVGPWAECKAIEQWLRDHTGEPASLQIIRWQSRQDMDGWADIKVSFRGKNQYGAMQVSEYKFRLIKGEVESVSDQTGGREWSKQTGWR